MWRVQGFVGRVLSRCHGNAPLRLPQNQYRDNEVINTSTLLSTSPHSSDGSSQQGEEGEKGKRRKRTSQFCYAGLPRYTALDAVGWGAAAVVVVQICKRIHSQFSSGGEPRPSAGLGHLGAPANLQRCGYYRLLLKILCPVSTQYVLPGGRSVSHVWGAPEILAQGSSEGTNSHSSSSQQNQNHSTPDSSFSHQQGAGLMQEPSEPEETGSFSQSFLPEHKPVDGGGRQEPVQENHQDVLLSEESLAEAALNLRQVADASVPVTLNIIGLESAKSGDLAAAFTCFLAAAHHGYSKAQFNTGVCYERGRGVGKDREKALQFYSQAAAGGHSQAQYRYARLLLSSRGQQSTQDLDTAISLLEKASVAGLTQAQVFLGALFSQEPIRDGCKSVHYLKMAAEGGDRDALLFLGQCYEDGFGVQQCLRTAVRFYKQAAQAGNSQAKSLLLVPPSGLEEDVVLRSIRSAPCFHADIRLRQLLSDLIGHTPPASHPSHPSLPLAHSWSTGSIGIPSSLSSIPLHLHPHPYPPSTDSAPCRWTIGVG